MEISGLLEDAELNRIPNGIQIQTTSGKESYNSMIQHISTNVSLLQKKAAFIYALRKNGDSSITSDFSKLAELEKEITPSSKSESEHVKDAVEGQIYFTSEYLSFLNMIPWVIRIFTFLKIYIAPISALFVPVVMMIMPYFMLHYMFNTPISWEDYQALMKRLVLGISPNEPWTLKHIVQAIWTVGSIGQSMFQPFFQAYHTYKLDNVYKHKGQALQTYVRILTNLVTKVNTYGARKIYIPPVSEDVYVAASLLEHHPKLIGYYMAIAGSLEVYWAISQNTAWNPVSWKVGKGLVIQGVSDICISPEKAIHSHIELAGHAILTGPNRGGKSSNLRGILQAVILGQIFGMAPVKYISYQPYDWIFTRLKTKDSPGKQSLFEKEVHAVGQILRYAKDPSRRGFVLIDELFHSTNPPDAEISAKVFLEQCWKHSHVQSIVSTHIFSLVKDSPSFVKFLCCHAEESSSGQIIYSYRLSPGVCTLSSVKEVLREARVLR
jgi:hypothetical protein